MTGEREKGNSSTRSGFATLAGRPNVGKSTLLNRILGAKLAIVTPKPQTTRHRLLGIATTPSTQTIWIDTPGLHRSPRRSPLNERMIGTARRAIAEADVVVAVVDAERGLTREDATVLSATEASGKPWIMALNKVDRIERGRLLLLCADCNRRHPSVDVVPVSALTGENVPELVDAVAQVLPERARLFDEDDLTDQTARWIVTEFVREKVFEQTGAEVPYRTAVLVDSFVERRGRDVNVVEATILVERDSQKRILVGAGGRKIREIGRGARLELERFFGVRFHLSLFVKVRKDWTRNPRVLDELGL